MYFHFFLLHFAFAIAETVHEDFLMVASNKKLEGHDVDVIQVKSLVKCSILCLLNSECHSFNYVHIGGGFHSCELKSAWCLDSNKVSLVAASSADHFAVKSVKFDSCRTYKERCPNSADGNYDVKLQNTNDAINVYCDMTTVGGGWTLVYVYGFTDYNNFATGSNAASPRPNWPVSDVSACTTTLSSTPPGGPTSHGAVNFNLWKKFGRDILVKSNINNLLKCTPVAGSLVDWIGGSISCTVLDDTIAPCPSGTVYVPDTFAVGTGSPHFNVGPILRHSSDLYRIYYSFTCANPNYYGPHDPCGRAENNFKHGVANPYGSIYIR